MLICSESLEEEYYEEFMAQRRKMLYGDYVINKNFINNIMKQI
jgi:hypothetical protein